MLQTTLVCLSFVVADVLTWIPLILLKQNHASILNAPPEQITLAIVLGGTLNLFTYFCLYTWAKKRTTNLIHISSLAGPTFGVGIAFAWFSVITFSVWFLVAGYFIKVAAYILQMYYLNQNFSQRS